MTKVFHRLSNRLATHDGWVFLAPAVALHTVRFTERSLEGWPRFVADLLPLLLLSAPVVVVAFLRDLGFIPEAGPRSIALRIATFVVYPALLIAAGATILPRLHPSLETHPVAGLASLLFALEAALVLQRTFRHRWRPLAEARRVSFERALVLVLALAALGLSAMAVSDLDAFLAAKAVEPRLDPSQIAAHLPTFVVVALQLFLAYLGGFAFYWINRHLLVRQLLRRRGPLHYLAGAALLVALGYPLVAQVLTWLPLHRSLQVLTPAENMNPFDPVNASVAIAILTLSLPLILVLEWFRQNSKIAELESQRTQTELDLLKQQIDPHFFFNTLNNLYALSRRRSEDTPEMILRLSEMMRYVIYRGREETVPIADEVRYLRDYLELQRIRLAAEVEIRFSTDLLDPTARVAPLLLIVPLENACKHGLAHSHDGASLDLRITSDRDTLRLVCRNSFEPRSHETPGIGLSNLRRRLELLYSNRHRLEIDSAGKIFELRLEVPLSRAARHEPHVMSRTS